MEVFELSPGRSAISEAGQTSKARAKNIAIGLTERPFEEQDPVQFVLRFVRRAKQSRCSCIRIGVFGTHDRRDLLFLESPGPI